MTPKVLIVDDEPNIVISLEFLMSSAATRPASRATARRRSPRSSGSGPTSCCST